MPQKKKLTPTTKTVDGLAELNRDGRLDLTPDFQRNSVWPQAAKAYLIDTILNDMPIPLLFLSRERDTNTNRLSYRVIDGQQRLRAVIAFLNDRLTIPNLYGITNRSGREMTRIRYRHLPEDMKDQFVGYSFVVTELSGYTDDELRGIFVRINRYVVRLNPQELRDAEEPGPFRDLVDGCVDEPVWEKIGIFTQANRNRKRDKEFIAELVILLLEGPQDKKGSVDLYYGATERQFAAKETREELLAAAKLAAALLGDEPSKLLLRLPAFYGLMGAIFSLRADEDVAASLADSQPAIQDALVELVEEVERLPAFEAEEMIPDATGDQALMRDAYIFRRSVSQQTDNVKPRTARIEVLERVIRSGLKT